MIRREGVMACYEHMRHKTEKQEDDDDMFWRLNNYFHALSENKLDEYHKKRGRIL